MHNIGRRTQSFRFQLSYSRKGNHQADDKIIHRPLHLTSLVKRRSKEIGDLGQQGEGSTLSGLEEASRDRKQRKSLSCWPC